MLYQPIFILTTDGTTSCVMTPSAKWCGTKLLMQDYIPTQCFDMLTLCVNPHTALPSLWYGLHTMDTMM